MRSTDITVILLLYKTPANLIQNLKFYKDFKIIILDQSNDFKLKQRLKTKSLDMKENLTENFSANISFVIKASAWSSAKVNLTLPHVERHSQSGKQSLFRMELQQLSNQSSKIKINARLYRYFPNACFKTY